MISFFETGLMRLCLRLRNSINHHVSAHTPNLLRGSFGVDGEILTALVDGEGVFVGGVERDFVFALAWADFYGVEAADLDDVFYRLEEFY